jgi:hypothetical protein
MTKLFLAAGVAALALAAPAAAENGKGGGKGNKGQSAKVERGNGGNKGAARKIERRGGGQKFAQRDDRRERKAERRELKVERQAFKADRSDFDRRDFDRRKSGRRDGDVVRIRDFDDDDRFDRRDVRRSLARWNDNDHCPPGLRWKNVECMPPGQYKKLGDNRLLPAAFRDRRLPLGLRALYRDDDDHYYRFGDGYVYRVDRQSNLIAALLPLLGGGLSTGQMFPSAFSNYYVPNQYRAFYPDNSDDYYRYANGYVYEVDRDSGLIESMIPLMANGYGMGQMLPPSYSAYNVPYQYRSYYADNDDYMYRYAPGAIYQVDRDTSLITAVASLLTGNGLSVGQRLPMGYSTYNVPLAYRDDYYDTPDAWYRYNNGNIYQVDPTTQLVTSIIRAIV